MSDRHSSSTCAPVLPAHRREPVDREALPEDGRVLDQGSFRCGQRVEASRDQGVQRLRDRQVRQVARRDVAAVGRRQATLGHQHPDRLDRVERDAVGAFGDRSERRIGEARNELGRAARNGGLRQWLEAEGHEVAPARTPVRSMLEQLRTGNGDDEDRDAAAPLDEFVDEVERAGIGPVQVLEDEGDRPFGGDPLEERPPRREQLLARHLGRRVDAQQGEERRLDPATLGFVGHPPFDGLGDLRPRGRFVVGLGQAGARADHLAERPERDALAVRGRSPGMPEDRLDDPVEVLRQLPDEPALARAGHADDGHDPRASLATGCVEQVLEQAELAVAAEERRLELVAPSAAAALGDDTDRAECRHRRFLALEDLLPGRFEGDRLVGGTFGGLADQDGSGLGDRLQPRRGIDEVARDHALVRRAERDCRFAGQDAGAGADAGAERLDRGDDVECRTDCSFGVVLARDRRAPHGHDRVADELLDRAAVAADHLAGKLEVARQELAGLLCVAALGQRREADEVGEQDRDEAAFRDRGVRGAGVCRRSAPMRRWRRRRRSACRTRRRTSPRRGAASRIGGSRPAAQFRTRSRSGRWAAPPRRSSNTSFQEAPLE